MTALRQRRVIARQYGLWPPGGRTAHDPLKRSPRPIDRRSASIRHVTDKYPPTMLIHGTSDTDVPHEQSVQMDRELARHGVPHEFISVTGGGHGLGGLDRPESPKSTSESGFLAHVIESRSRSRPSRCASDVIRRAGPRGRFVALLERRLRSASRPASPESLPDRVGPATLSPNAAREKLETPPGQVTLGVPASTMSSSILHRVSVLLSCIAGIMIVQPPDSPSFPLETRHHEAIPRDRLSHGRDQLAAGPGPARPAASPDGAGQPTSGQGRREDGNDSLERPDRSHQGRGAASGRR